jgi:hypothetical protein
MFHSYISRKTCFGANISSLYQLYTWAISCLVLKPIIFILRFNFKIEFRPCNYDHNINNYAKPLK